MVTTVTYSSLVLSRTITDKWNRVSRNCHETIAKPGTVRRRPTSTERNPPSHPTREDDNMIKRGLRKSADEAAAANGRPGELITAPHDPDSATAWMAEGNCRLHPPATFFPSDGVGVDKARKICRDCPVVDTCLDYALEERIDHGVWGGCSERERRRILKRRRLEAAAEARVN